MSRQSCINLWNVGWALHSQNSIHLHSKNPKFPMVKAVHYFQAWSNGICQKWAFKSKQKYPVPTKLLMASFICQSRYESFLVLAFNLQKLKQNCRPPSFMPSNTMALHHGLWLGWKTPTLNISFTWTWTSYTIGGGILQNLSLKASSSMTLISCFARLVQPNSPGSKKDVMIFH